MSITHTKTTVYAGHVVAVNFLDREPVPVSVVALTVGDKAPVYSWSASKPLDLTPGDELLVRCEDANYVLKSVVVETVTRRSNGSGYSDGVASAFEPISPSASSSSDSDRFFAAFDKLVKSSLQRALEDKAKKP